MSVFRTITRKLKGLMFRHVRAMITCAEFEKFVLDYFEDRLSPGRKKVFELHLKLCSECRDYLKAYWNAVELGKTVFKEAKDTVPTDVPEDLVSAILAARSADSGGPNGDTS